MSENINKKCSCPHCSPELTNGCFSPEFCKPCGANKKVKICQKCKAEYLAEYEECPACKTAVMNDE